MKNGIFTMLAEKAKHLWHLEQERPLQVSVMGQTGVGKSSLVNALFGANFKVSSIRPETLEPQMWKEERSGHTLEFWDLPGLGETSIHDERYIEEYKSKLLSSNIVLWAVHADSRSFSLDRAALEKLLASLPSSQRGEVMNKMIFVLTKADLLNPSPWVLTKIGCHGVFTIRQETEELLAEKEQYFQEAFITPFGRLLKAQTFHRGDFSVKDDHMEYDGHSVSYRGFLSKSRCEELNKKNPEYQEVFTRLYNAYRVIPCSSLFRFNLDMLMQVIVDKLALRAIASLENFRPCEVSLKQLSFEQAKHFGNMIIFDEEMQQVYDLSILGCQSDSQERGA